MLLAAYGRSFFDKRTRQADNQGNTLKRINAMKGRPTKYTDEIQEQADTYVNGGFADCGDIVPSRAGLALELHVSRETLTNWERAHPIFLGTLQRLSWIQERVSLNGGLKGELNSTIVKLLLANHGYSDKVEQSHTSPDGSMTPSPTRIELVAPNDNSES